MHAPPRREAPGHSTCAPRDDLDAVDTRRRDELRAALECGRDVAHVGGSLGRRGTSERAHPLAVAVGRVPDDRVVAPHPERVSAARDDPTDPPRELPFGARDAEHRLDPRVVRIHRVARERVEPEVFAPPLEDPLGGAVAGAAVDDGAPPDGAPREDRRADVAERDGHPFVAIELLHHRLRAPGERVASMKVPLFEHHDGAPAHGELVGARRAAGAGADDDHLAFELEIFLDGAPVGDLLHPPRRLGDL